MTFATPILLATLLLVPLAIAAYLAAQRRRSRYAVRFTNVDLLANIAPRTPGWRRHVPAALSIAAVAFLAVALARPSMTLDVPREEATVMLAMDVSRSMQATDVSPTRLDAAKAAASSFVEGLPKTFRVGLVAFSTDARLLVPPTQDHAQVLDAIATLQADGGTALGDALAIALDATADARSASAPADGSAPAASADPVPSAAPGASATPGDPATPAQTPVTATILLSDGANSTGAREPLDVAKDAARDGMPIYAIALGTSDGVVDVQDQFGQTQQLQVPPDTDTLQRLAEMTGGKAFDAPTATDLAQVYESLGSKVGTVRQEQEVTQWFAAAALLLVVTGAALSLRWFNRFP